MTRYPLPFFVQRFFTERLANQFAASANTVASYRDTFRLLLIFGADRLGRQPTDLLVTDIDADLVGRFLDFVETSRGNSARSRNTRLAAIRSFFKYVAINEPALLHHCQRVLALPSKRHERRMIDCPLRQRRGLEGSVDGAPPGRERHRADLVEQEPLRLA